MYHRRVWIFDTETTGLDPETCKVVELAGILLDGDKPVKHYETLVNPGVPIPPEACAIHHITDEQVKDAPTLEEALQPILKEEFDYFVAHHADYDKKFIPVDKPWLCTWKLANVVFQDAPGYGNQVLRYHLGGFTEPVLGKFPHRALYDVEITAQIFQRILATAKAEDPYPIMLDVSQKPVRLKGKVGFGVYADRTWDQVPVDYLGWMLKKSSGWDENRLHTAKFWLEQKTQETS